MYSSELHPTGVYEIVVNNPPVNAFGIALLTDLSREFQSISERPEVMAVLLRSAGRGFAAGGDVKEVEQLGGFAGILGQANGSMSITTAILECAVPVICAVHAYCVGLGTLIAGAADILIAASGTRFVLAEVDNGATTGAVHALKLMPEKRARAAMMTAEPVLAEELHALGSILEVVQETELAATAMRVAEQVAAKPSASMRLLKESFNNSSKAAEVRALYRAELSYTYELNMIGLATEGREDFIEKKRSGY